MNRNRPRISAALVTALFAATLAAQTAPRDGERLALIGNGLGERMLYFGHFETELHARFPEAGLIVRNLCHPGNTPGFRPHSARKSQWAFAKAAEFRPEFATHFGIGHFPTPDEWLTSLRTDTIVAFFGFNESFDGPAGLAAFTGELEAFIEHTAAQRYNGTSAPRLILVSPIAFEDLSASRRLPNGEQHNANLELYADAMATVAERHDVEFVDVFRPTAAWFAQTETPLTINGCHLGDRGYRRLAPLLVDGIYGPVQDASTANRDLLRRAVLDKDWMWRNDYRVLNGVHVYGRRHKPFGNVNYPEEIEKTRQMTALRDERIGAIARGETTSGAIDDSATRALTAIETNFDQPIDYLDEARALQAFTLPEGFEIGLFASEKEFPDLRNPVQMSFDNRGRLWVSVLPSYPHYRPGDPRPDDKLLILEDTDGDGRADRQTVFADGLQLPIGFELTAEGVYVSEEPNVLLLRDTDGDDRADERHIVLGGFDSHDTHHAISAYCADASGAFYLCEGRFLHTQVETPYGPVRSNDGGIYRFDPSTGRLQCLSQYDYNNPWGIAFDEWGQDFVADASGGANYWLLPLSAKLPYGAETPAHAQFTTHRVRPTSGAEFLSSRHFPDEMQGDFLINNTIGFLGTKQHVVRDDGAGFTGELRQDLVRSTDPNYRPVDLEIAPDGSLFVVDWCNALVGHMQHSARDPNRDHEHGRIYRVTCKGRPLVAPATIAGAPIATLLENLKLPEYRSRYRTRRELRGRPADAVVAAVREWTQQLDASDPHFARHLLEGLWATWAQGRVDARLLRRCLTSDEPRLRAAAVRVLRYAHDQIDDSTALFLAAATDPHPRVRLEAIIAASWLDDETGARIALEALKQGIEKWMDRAFEAAMVTLRDDAERAVAAGRLDLADNVVARRYLAGELDFKPKKPPEATPITNLSAADTELWKLGKEVYHRDAHCATCHQANGKGIANVYPPLGRNAWVRDDDERLIKIALKGLWGPIQVQGKTFDPIMGVPPMTGFGPLLSDREIAGVLTYVRNSFGNRLPAIQPEAVARVRAATAERVMFYKVDELLNEHPMPADHKRDGLPPAKKKD